MPLPEFTRRLVETILTKYCAQKMPPHARDKIRFDYRIRGNHVTLYTERPRFDKPSEWADSVVAQFRFNHQDKKWSLYCADRNSRWHLYTIAAPRTDFEALLREVDRDPTGIFYG